MLGGLDPLGDHAQAEVVGEIDGRAHDHQIVVVVGHLEHERLVDLELVQRQALQVRERRVAGAEVVDRQADPEIVQPEQVSPRAVGIVHDRGLGELEGEPGRIDPPFGQQRADGLGQLLVVQAAGREVDRDADLEARLLPVRQLAERGIEAPAGERLDQAGLLGVRDELVGQDRALVRVAPAGERLDAVDRAGQQVELGLELERQLAALDRLAERARERQVPDRVAILVAVVELDRPGALLGRIHRDVGALQKARRVVGMLREQRDADADADLEPEAVGDLERPLHRVHDPFGHAAGTLEVGGRRQQDRELVAAEPRDRVAVADAVVETPGEMDQEQVAEMVAERVVDLLEAIEVEQQQRQRFAVAGRRAQRLGQAVVEQHAIGQAGQGIVHRLVAQPVLLSLGGGDVAHDRDQEPLVLDHGRAQRDLDREGGAVLTARQALEAIAVAGARGLEPPVLGQVGEQLQDVAPDQVRRPTAEHAQRRFVGGVDPTVGAHREDAIEALLHDVAHQGVELLELLAVDERELGLAAVDDPRELHAVPHQQRGTVLATGGAMQHGGVDALPGVSSGPKRTKSALGLC